MLLQYRHHPPALKPRPTTHPALLLQNCHYPPALKPNQLLAPTPPALNPPTDYLPRGATHKRDPLASCSLTCFAHSPKVHGNSHLPGAHNSQEKGNHYPLESLALKVRHQPPTLVLDLGCPSSVGHPLQTTGTLRDSAPNWPLCFSVVSLVPGTQRDSAPIWPLCFLVVPAFCQGIGATIHQPRPSMFTRRW